VAGSPAKTPKTTPGTPKAVNSTKGKAGEPKSLDDLSKEELKAFLKRLL